MFTDLPEDIIWLIIDFLSFSEWGNLCVTHKTIPKISIPYNCYERKTIYVVNGKETVESTYLLTNGPKRLPGQIKHNFVEIRLVRGMVNYEYVIYKNIYDPKKDIINYLQQALNFTNKFILSRS